MKTRTLVLAFTCFGGWLLFSPVGMFAQVRGHMMVEGIQGPSTEERYRGWFEVEQVSRDIYPRTAQSGPELLTVVKLVDGSSGALQHAYQNGTQFTQVMLEFTRPRSTGEVAVFQRVKLGSAKIASINQQYAAGRNVQEIKFSYQRLEQEDIDTERPRTSIRTGWDFVRNIPLP